MVFAGQRHARWSHFADDLPVDVREERHKRSHLGEGEEVAILVGLQDRDDIASFGVQPRQEFGGHPLAIDDHPCHLAVPHKLLKVPKVGGNTCGEMLITVMGGDKQGMTVLVMQQEKGSAAQDDAQTPDQPTWDERVTVDGLAMSVHIAGQRVRLCCFSCFFHWCVPEVRGPAGKGIGKAFGSIGTRFPVSQPGEA